MLTPQRRARHASSDLCSPGHRKGHDPDEHAAAVTELRDLAAGRADLLAEEAGLLIGCCEYTIKAPVKCQSAGLLIAAGADPDLIPGWIEEGRRRRPYRHPTSAR